MKYVIYAFNFLTLSKAIRYIDSVWTRNNSLLLYTNTVSRLPSKIAEEYQCVLYDYDDENNQQYSFLKRTSMAVHLFWKALREFTSDDENVTLVVFRDNQFIECSMIDRFHKKFGSREIVLMEEGAGLYLNDYLIDYRTGRDNFIRRILRKTKYKFYGVTTSSTHGKPFGYNPYINRVVGSKVSGLKERYKDTSVVVEQQIDIFTPEFSRDFVKKTVNHEIMIEEYDYVFLTQPLNELVGGTEKEIIEIYDSFLIWFFKHIKDGKKLIIKPHPRDNYDYSKYSNGKIALCDKDMNKLPYECLSAFWQYPREFTFCSSACINSKSNRGGVYMYKLLRNNLVGATVDVQYINDNGIFVCDNLDQLERILNEA